MLELSRRKGEERERRKACIELQRAVEIDERIAGSKPLFCIFCAVFSARVSCYA